VKAAVMMKPRFISWTYLLATAILCGLVTVRSPMVTTSSSSEVEPLGLLVWIAVSVGLGVIHDQSSVISSPRVFPWKLVVVAVYAIALVALLQWAISSNPNSSGVVPVWQRVLGAGLAWVLFCAVPWTLGRWTAHDSSLGRMRKDGAP
jgi:hypothetical protein